MYGLNSDFQKRDVAIYARVSTEHEGAFGYAKGSFFVSVRFNFSLLLCLAQALQVFQNERAVCGDLPQRRAAARLLAVCAGVQLLFPNAVMHGAELVAERRFCAFYAASGAAYHVRRDRHAVELCPQFGGFIAQSAVVCDRCDSCIALFAVQPAAADQLVCAFHSCLHKFNFF